MYVPHDVIVSMPMTKEKISELSLHVMSHIDSVLFLSSLFSFLLLGIAAVRHERLLKRPKVTLALFPCWAGALNIRSQILEDNKGTVNNNFA